LVGYYAVTKAEASQAVLDAVAAHPELDASIVHPSGICGPNDFSFGPVAQMVAQYMSGEVKIGLEGTFNSVDVRDLANGVIACCEKGRRGECYIMGNELVTMKELYELINQAADLDIHANILSKGVAGVAVKVLKFQSKFTKKEPLLTDFGLYNLTRNNDFDCTKAETELGFKCRPFSETIKDEVEWLKEEASNAPDINDETKQDLEELTKRVKLGEVSNIIVKKNNEELFTLPVAASMAVGIGSFLLVPYLVIPGAMIAYGNVTIEVEGKDGKLYDIKGNLIS
ncbi:MAG: DUF4342 domain-containing protein, partial [Lachnospiraceae bacterium]|nr:DUF4342 domain-containing protein [Lachnospiraceae bacterium]